MYVYLKDSEKIVDTDVCEEVVDLSDYNKPGKYYGPVKYRAPDGTEFWVDRSKFSNLPDLVWEGELEDRYTGLKRIEFPDLPCVDDRSDELESLLEEYEYESDEYAKKELEEDIKELQEHQKVFEELIPGDAEVLLDADNIYMGASTPYDYGYRNYVIYRDGDGGFYVEVKKHDYHGIAPSCDLEDEQLKELLLAIYDNWDYKKALEILAENKDRFDIDVIDSSSLKKSRRAR